MLRLIRRLPALLLPLLLASAQASALVLSFQEGSGGYTGTQDTEIQLAFPTSSFGADPIVRADAAFSGGDVQGLLGFDSIFGAGPGQIPLGSVINSAVLTLSVTNSSNSPVGNISVYRMTTAWSESSTWNSLTGGVQVGSETDATPDDVHTVESLGLTTFDVQAALQAWSGGASNFGWMISNDSGDGLEFESSEAATVSVRPLLTVDFTPVPEPNSLVLSGLAGAAALCLRRLRRMR
jgi:hypothetical protein